MACHMFMSISLFALTAACCGLVRLSRNVLVNSQMRYQHVKGKHYIASLRHNPTGTESILNQCFNVVKLNQR